MNGSALDISVVICAYTHERWGALTEAIQSVQRQTAPPREIIVVVDHNPELLERVQRTFAGVLATPNVERRGLSGARNSGVAAAAGAIIAFLDDDGVAAEDWLARLAAAYGDEQVVGVGGSIAPYWEGDRPAWFPEEFDWVVGCTYRGMPEAAAAVRNLIGANMSFRRQELVELGGFEHGIGRVGAQPTGCEETELCIRARQRWPRRTLRYEPSAQVLHRVPHGRARWAYFRARCYAEGRSKSLVTQLVGAQDGLSSEWSYTLHTLPRGIVRNAAWSIARRDRAGLMRAGAIAGGLCITIAGYAMGQLAQRRAWRREGAPAAMSSTRG